MIQIVNVRCDRYTVGITQASLLVAPLNMRNSRSNILCQLDFPIFNIRFLSNDLFIISGGGGSSKTGVPNKIIFFKIYTYNGIVKSKNIHEIDTKEQLANSIEYIREKSMLFVGYNDTFQIIRLSLEYSDCDITVTTSCVGIFDICDINMDNCSDGLTSLADTNPRNAGDASSCSIRAITNMTDSYISDLIILPDQHQAGNIKIIVAINYGLIVISEIKDDINFEIQQYKSYKPIKRLKIDPTHKNIIQLTPEGIIYVWSYPNFQLISNIDLNVSDTMNVTKISCKCFTFMTDKKSRKPLLVAAFTKSPSSSTKKTKNSDLTTYVYKFGVDDFLPIKGETYIKSDRIVSIDAIEIGTQSYLACGTLNGSILAIDGHNSKIIGQSKNIHTIGVTSLSFTREFCDNDEQNDGSSVKPLTKLSAAPLGILSCSADSSCAYTSLVQLNHKKSSSYFFIACFFLAIIASWIIGSKVELLQLA